MPRSRKNNPVTEMPVDFPIQHEPGSHGGIFDDIPPIETSNTSNVIPFTSTGNDQAFRQNRDTAQLDQFLAQYGIEFI
ncbi:hypothetical protein [Leptolyngbya sp. FACHB-17]|uniref:hypothetical protein n=1 Tax=unclassified Leptolyngbya TaxID=2650499 RepID=UPI0016819E36|nr:hypothetical protein [Leptolyngbya sp. FACHB-17]MBD2083370.1 hypothetical protein [Leptolyngbya sp. FACHB-17]